jgi:hypothetical protein
MEPKLGLFLAAIARQTEVTVVVAALAIFVAGFVLGVLWCSWVGRRRRRQEAAAELKRKARA